jgi:hypothetical protein
VGGRLLAGKQDLERVAEHLLVAVAPLALGGEHALEEVLWLLAEL